MNNHPLLSNYCQDFQVPNNEEERLKTLYRLGLLNTAAEASLDRITSLASRLFKAPISLITLLDKDTQIHKSRFGWEMAQIPRRLSVCTHTILDSSPDVFVIDDCSAGQPWCENPLVQGNPHIRFYAGAPLLYSDEDDDKKNVFKIGALCVIDTKPRDRFSIEEKMTLLDLADMAVAQIKLRQELHQKHVSFSSSIAHNLRTPLTSLELCFEMLKQTMADKPSPAIPRSSSSTTIATTTTTGTNTATIGTTTPGTAAIVRTKSGSYHDSFHPKPSPNLPTAQHAAEQKLQIIQQAQNNIDLLKWNVEKGLCIGDGLHHLSLRKINMVNCEEFSLSLLSEKFLKMAKLLSNPNDLFIQLRVESTCPETLYTDHNLIVYASVELVANGLQHGKPNSPSSSEESNSVQVIISGVKDPKAAGTFVRIEVRDHGAGIPTELHTQIFRQPLPKPDGSNKLGLYSVQMYMLMLGGRTGFKVNNNNNNNSGGSTVWIEFPADFRTTQKQDELKTNPLFDGIVVSLSPQTLRNQEIQKQLQPQSQQQAQNYSIQQQQSQNQQSQIPQIQIQLPILSPPSQQSQNYSINSLKILVVDDNPTIRMMLSRLLEKQGVKSVVQAENGKMAYEFLTLTSLSQSPSQSSAISNINIGNNSAPFSVVFLDFLMPIMNGLDALESFRKWQQENNNNNKNDNSKKLPIFIGISANAQDPDIERGKAMGMHFFVHKPITMKIVQDILCEVITLMKNYNN